MREFTRAEIAKGDADGDGRSARFVIHDKVYDVTGFLNEHPGGEEVLLDHANGDASADFDDVGHSLDALALMDKYVVGEIVPSERRNTQPRKGWIAGGEAPGESGARRGPPGLTLLFLAGAVLVLFLALLYFQ